MSTTYNELVAALAGLSVSGVTRQYTQGPPAALNSADLPAQWVELSQGDEAPISVGGTWPTLRADLVVAYEAAGQGTQPANFEGTVDVMDALVTALRGLSLGQTKPAWEIRLEMALVARSAYWAVVASVTVEG